MRGPEAHPATNLETLNDFLAEAMAVALYEYREGSLGHPRHSSRRLLGTAEAKGPFQCSPGLASTHLRRPTAHTVQTRDAQLSGLPTWAIAGIEPGLAG
ncbi:hypothetical protein Ddc_17847 [Ditylenchus destructor]|nr:hypothetical protein Ddc_17847 [Ditylenchus destructor]